MDESKKSATGDDQAVSERIRKRLQNSRMRFHANDNIAASSSRANSTCCSMKWPARCRACSSSLVIDTENDHNTQDTARRVAKMYLNEVFRGRYCAAAPRHRISQRRPASTNS